MVIEIEFGDTASERFEVYVTTQMAGLGDNTATRRALPRDRTQNESI